MKRIRYTFAVLIAALAIAGCSKKEQPLSDHPFDITTPKVEATRAVVDVIPENNDFHYMFGIMDAETFELVGEQMFIEVVDKLLKETYKVLFDTTSLENFLDWMYRGAYDETYHDLKPMSRYIVYALPYIDTIPAAEKFTKLEFLTPELKVSDNTFSVSVEGSVISVVPSNNDQYFFDYCDSVELAKNYGKIELFYKESIDTYWEYGFLENFLVKGNNQEDIQDYYDEKIKDGDIFYMAISGYDNGITTELKYYKIVVHFGGTAQSTIEEIQDFQYVSRNAAVSRTLPMFCKKTDYSANKVSLKRLKR